MTEYLTTIGLEIHCQINTKTKMFCRCSNDSFNKSPNSNVCPICMGFPGQLPRTNEEAIKKGIIAGLALGCRIPRSSKFDRKNYFYPDSPKGYQITQFDEPIAQEGQVMINTSEGEKCVELDRMHLEDDAGKLTHTPHGSLCDYNRAGTPLMEIVTKPVMETVEEASAYAREVQRIMRYCKSSDADMEKGMMRFDINVSIRPEGQEELGAKVEVKNLNSFQSLEKALEYEIKRQNKAVKNGEEIVQETRGWDAESQKTVSQRSKEQAHDYRYFPEPDLPPVITEEDTVDQLRKMVPELPFSRRKRFEEEFKLHVDDIAVLTESAEMADFFEKAVELGGDAKLVSSFTTTILQKHLNEDGIEVQDSKITPEHIGELVKLVGEGTISNNIAKSTVFEKMYAEGTMPGEIVKSEGLEQISDTSAIEAAVKAAMEANPKAVEDIKNGKEKAIGAIVGAVMKETKGQANPQMINECLKKLL